MEMHQDYERIASAIRFIVDNQKNRPTLQQVAEAVNLSEFHFQRLFTNWAGVSPKKFLQFLTVEYAKNLLSRDEEHSLLQLSFESGLSGSGRLHDLFISMEGMTPGEYRNGGEDLTIQYTFRESLFGKYLIASTGKGICDLHFIDAQESDMIEKLKALWPNARLVNNSDNDQEKVDQFFQRHLSSDDKIRLHLKGSPFQLKVWQALLQIPESKLTSYGTIANKIENPGASRAVGSAIGSNRVAFIIPCHRVIKSAGDLGQFRWGEIRKKALVAWEASQIQKES